MMLMFDLFWVFFWLMLLGIVLVFLVALAQESRGCGEHGTDEHETNPGAAAPGLPHHRRKK
jgi:hypothetical protein